VSIEYAGFVEALAALAGLLEFRLSSAVASSGNRKSPGPNYSAATSAATRPSLRRTRGAQTNYYSKRARRPPHRHRARHDSQRCGFQNRDCARCHDAVGKVIAVAPNTSVADAISLSRSSGFDRLPVITGGGEAVGLVNPLDILLDKNGAQSLSHYTRRIAMAQENDSAYRLIQRLLAARLGLAAVVDPRRKLIGIVTGEDLIRRLVSSAR
jgi:CBS domain-containing protein